MIYSKILVYTLLFLFIMFSNIENTYSAEVLPNSSCADIGQIIHSGGPEIANKSYFLICDGNNWKSIFEFNDTGSVLVRIGVDSSLCTATKEGNLRYASNSIEVCDGSNWTGLSGGGGGGGGDVIVTEDNGSCTSVKLGKLRYDGSTLEICNGSSWTGISGR